MQELLNHIKAKNAESRAWAAESEGRWAGEFSEESAHWQERGITTIEAFNEMLDIEAYADLHKSAYGFRPRHEMPKGEELRKAMERMSKDNEESMKREQEQAEKAANDFEKRVSDTIALGAKDRATALRWLMDGQDVQGVMQIEHFVWELGFLGSKRGVALAKEMCDVYGKPEWKEFIF